MYGSLCCCWQDNYSYLSSSLTMYILKIFKDYATGVYFVNRYVHQCSFNKTKTRVISNLISLWQIFKCYNHVHFLSSVVTDLSYHHYVSIKNIVEHSDENLLFFECHEFNGFGGHVWAVVVVRTSIHNREGGEGCLHILPKHQ